MSAFLFFGFFFVFCRTVELKVASCHLMCHTVVVVAVSPGTGQVMVLFQRERFDD